MKNGTLVALILACLFSTVNAQPKLHGDSTIVPANDEQQMFRNRMFGKLISGLINKPAPSFQLNDLNKNSWELEKLRGKVVVLNFWFTSCKPCIDEIPRLNDLVASMNDSAIVFIAVAPDDEKKIKKFLIKFPFRYNIAPSALDYISLLGVENFPTHILIDKRGIIRQILIGYSNDIGEKLSRETVKLLREPNQ